MNQTDEPSPSVQRRVRFGERWDRVTQWPLAAAALAFLGAYSALAIVSDLSPTTRTALRLVDYVTWALFVVDYAIRLITAARRWRFFTHNLLELAVVALPVLRPLRLLRLFTLFRVLNRSATKSFHGRVGLYTAFASILVVYSGSLAVLQAERGHPGANIRSFGIALWWAVTTVTTVGYGDYTPVTVEGRIIATALMLTGIALIGVVTASIASYFVERFNGPTTAAPNEAESERDSELAQLRSEVAELSALLRHHVVPRGATAGE